MTNDDDDDKVTSSNVQSKDDSDKNVFVSVAPLLYPMACPFKLMRMVCLHPVP